MNEPIEVVDYDTRWAGEFERLRSALWSSLQGVAAAIEHVGSTSVPGLAAKPILDIDIVVAGQAELQECVAVLSDLGWKHRGDLGIEGRHAFTRNPDFFAHNLYVCLQGSDSLTNHLLFRDHLRSSPAAVQRYGTLKRELAKEHRYDIDGYVAAKTDFIVEILAAQGMSSSALRDIARANEGLAT